MPTLPFNNEVNKVGHYKIPGFFEKEKENARKIQFKTPLRGIDAIQ